MLRIALIGYGKMGRMIESMAAQQGAEVVAVIDPGQSGCGGEISESSIRDAEVCIEFSHPSAVIGNIGRICELGKNLVVGTTGWAERLEEVKRMVNAAGIGMIYGSNLSIGMNLFYEIVEVAARDFSAYREYDVFGYELHHRQKADSPSGTARELSGILLEAGLGKSSAQYDKLDRRIDPGELHFASVRAGFVPGTHVVCFDSEADTVELTHRVRNRSGFALGALKAAHWIAGKQGLHTFRDFIRTGK